MRRGSVSGGRRRKGKPRRKRRSGSGMEKGLCMKKNSMERAAAREKSRKNFKRSIPLLLMFLPVIVYYLVFKFEPMVGLIMAFENFNLKKGFFGSQFIGLQNFKYIFSTPIMLRVIKNTLVLGLLSFIIRFPFPVILALFLNEVRQTWLKKTVQTIVYLPHFFSWVVVGGVCFTIFSQENGIVNNILTAVSGSPYPFLYKPVSWICIFVGSGVWKETGFAAIIYLAALAGIDPSLYEAAALDGCTKFKKMIHVSIPCIAPTIIINLILQAGSIATVGFDQVYNLVTDPVMDVADVISTWVYRVGLQQMQFGISTAMGLFNSLLSLILVFAVNAIARKFDKSLW
jgi:putative aldouronate transport system permease protein